MDPPFNQDVHYPGGKPDRVDPLTFATWLLILTDAALDAVRENGVVIVHLPDRWIPTVAEWAYRKADERYKHLRVVNWCLWTYTFGQCPTGPRLRFTPSKAHALVLSPGRGNWTFTRAGLVTSDRAKQNDPRTMVRSARSAPPPGLKPRNDRFDAARIVGNSKERRGGHPNQLPEPYVAQFVGTFTEPGDLVVDPFCGSGTTATVARAMQRRSITCDISPEIADSAASRIRSGVVRSVEVAAFAGLE